MAPLESDYLSNETTLHSELVIGLVCAVGTESRQVVELLQERLGLAGYSVELVKISKDVIPQLVTVENYEDDNFERYSHLMDAGNQCRELRGHNQSPDDSILALGAATVISTRREKWDEPRPLPKTAFIVDSLKRPEEVEKLRIIYPSGFVLIGIHSEEERRRKHLRENQGMNQEQADQLLGRDSEETKTRHGQRVNDTFHLADFFVRLTNDRERLRFEIQRIIELIFGNPFLTPTFDEYAMFLAFTAALRSADLSRQVGAVICKNSQVLSTGANECPEAGGGLYWPVEDIQYDPNDSEKGFGCARDVPSGRDYTRGDGDSNRAEQIRIIDQIVKEVRKVDHSVDVEVLRSILRKSGIKDLTEFGRVVHAEMEALLSCTRIGVSTLGATLYSTTFPCHNCAKHIVAAGIKRVVYVEPYPKSKALSFHDDSVCALEESSTSREERVTFEPFFGVGPRRFFELFSMNLGSSYPLVRKDKDTGKRKNWSIEDAQLRLQMNPASYLELELSACKAFSEKLNLNAEEENP